MYGAVGIEIGAVIGIVGAQVGVYIAAVHVHPCGDIAVALLVIDDVLEVNIGIHIGLATHEVKSIATGLDMTGEVLGRHHGQNGLDGEVVECGIHIILLLLAVETAAAH